MKVYREITPLDEKDVFVILDSIDKGFAYPIHNHAEYELTLVIGSIGTRIVGDSTDRYYGTDLALIGPYLFHKWDSSQQISETRPCRVITIQFGMNLFDTQILSKEPFYRIKKFLERSGRGMLFHGRTLEKAQKRMIRLTKLSGLESFIEFIRLLDLLSKSGEIVNLASEGFRENTAKSSRTRIQISCKYILDHFQNQQLKISDVARKVNMSDSSFSHYFKKNTNRSYTRFLLDVRVGHACKLLIDTDLPVGEIAFASGFNNITNFNRLFKKYKGSTPLDYRKLYREESDFDWSRQITPFQFIPSGARVEKSIKPRTYSTKLVHS